MPLVRIPTTGATLVASAQVVRRQVFTVPAGAAINASNKLALQVNNLPNAFFYLIQTTGANGISFAPFFAVDNTDVAGRVRPNWLQLAPPTGLLLATPSSFTVRLIANMITLGIANPTGAPATITCVIGASQ